MIYRKTKLIVIPKKAGSLWQKSCEFHSKLSVYVVLSCHSQMVNTNTLVRSTFNCYIKKKNVSSIHAVSPPTLAPQFSNLKSVKMHSNRMYCWPSANYHAIISVLPPWASGLQLYCGCLRAWALTCVRYTADKVCVLMSRRWKCKFCDLGIFIIFFVSEVMHAMLFLFIACQCELYSNALPSAFEGYYTKVQHSLFQRWDGWDTCDPVNNISSDKTAV